MDLSVATKSLWFIRNNLREINRKRNFNQTALWLINLYTDLLQTTMREINLRTDFFVLPLFPLWRDNIPLRCALPPFEGGLGGMFLCVRIPCTTHNNWPLTINMSFRAKRRISSLFPARFLTAFGMTRGGYLRWFASICEICVRITLHNN